MTTVYQRNTNPDLTSAVTWGQGNLYEIAEQLLLRTIDAAARLAIELPKRHVIYPAPVPVDCAQVSITINGWSPTVQWDGFIACQSFKVAGQFGVIITRASPAVPTREGKLPSAAVMNSAGKIASDDCDILLAVLQGLEEIGPEPTISAGAAEGGFQSVELTVALPAFGGLG